jgi:hypothetical protein
MKAAKMRGEMVLAADVEREWSAVRSNACMRGAIRRGSRGGDDRDRRDPHFQLCIRMELQMKRDMELVREILTKIEQGDGRLKMAELLPEGASNEEAASLRYHMTMLVDETNLVTGNCFRGLSGNDWINLNLTWNGHEFLDTVRDPEVWKRTKEGAKSAGNFSIQFLLELGKAYAKHVAKERLGLDLS